MNSVDLEVLRNNLGDLMVNQVMMQSAIKKLQDENRTLREQVAKAEADDAAK